MAVTIEDELRRLTGELRSMNRGFDAIQRGLSGRDRAAELLEESLRDEAKRRKDDARREKAERRHRDVQSRYEGERAARRTRDVLNGLGTGANNATAAIGALTSALVGKIAGGIAGGLVGGLVIGLADFSFGLTKTYTQMADIGQTFSGDIFQMSSQAAAAGMSLDEFSGMLKKSSVTASIMAKAGTSLPQLAQNVRNNAEQFGMYGMTLDQLNDITATYADQLRLTGQLGAMNSTKARDDIMALAKNVSGLAIVFGKSRDEIMKTWDKAMRHEQVVAAKMMMTEDQLATFNKGFAQSIMTLAGQPGKLGEILSEMAAEAAGSGTAVFSTGAKTFIDAGMGQAVAMMEEMRNRIAANPDEADEATVEMMNKLRASIRANLPSLREQALAGNEAAKQIILMGSEMREVTVEQIRDARKNAESQKKFTQFMLKIENVWNNFTGKIKSFLIDRLGDTVTEVANRLDEWMNSGDFTKFMEDLVESGRGLAEKLGVVFNSKGVVDAVETSKKFTTALGSAISGLGTMASYLKVFTDSASAIGGFVKTLFGGKAGEGFPDLLVGLGAVIAGFKTLGLILTGLTKLGGMYVNAKIVNLVNGSPGVDGAGKDRPGKGKSRLGKIGAGIGSVTAVGAIGAAADTIGVMGDKPSLGDIASNPTRSFVEALDPGLANLIWGNKPNTPQGTFDPSKVEPTMIGEATGWLRGKVGDMFGAIGRMAVGDDTRSGAPREPDALKRARETLASRERQLEEMKRQGKEGEAAALVKAIADLQAEVARQTQVLAGQNVQSLEQQRKNQRNLNDVLLGNQ